MDLELYLACGPKDDVPSGVTPVRAAYRLDDDGALCALPLPCRMQGGLLLLTASAGRCGDRTAAAILQECHRRRYRGVVVPFPAPSLVRALARPLYRAGLELWLHEQDAPTAPGCWVLVNTSLTRGSLQERLSQAVRAFGPERIVLDLQRLRMDFPLPCPGGDGTYLTAAQLCRLQNGRTVFYSKELGVRYFTYHQDGASRFVLLDDGDTLKRKLALGAQLCIPRGLLTLPECGDILPELLAKS